MWKLALYYASYDKWANQRNFLSLMSAHIQSIGMYGYSGDARIYNAERVEPSVTSSHFVYFVCVCVCVQIKSSSNNKGPYDFSQPNLLQELNGEHTVSSSVL